MSAVSLEDFGPAGIRFQSRGAPVPPVSDRFDDGYNAGWDDAMARSEAEQTRIGETLADRLSGMEHGQRAAMAVVLATLEPAMRDIFDRLLPRTVERAFLPLLLDEVEATLASSAERLTVLVAPEDATPMMRLMERAGIDPVRAVVTAEPALSISQALIRWTGQERRIDLEGVLGALDDALETFLATMDRGTDAAGMKEASNG